MTNNQQNDLSDESAKSDWPSSVNFVSGTFHEATGPHVHSSDLVGVLWAGRYEILQLLGSGGMGVVYSARNRVNGQVRAIKILHHDFLTDRDAVRRFQNEVKAAQRIHNENVIQIIDEGIGDNQVPFLVMEFVHGRSLATVLRDDSHFSLNSKLHVFLQICSALAAAHDNGVVHRDIKPSNVLIVDSPRDKYFVKVLDFGIAKLMPRSEDGTIAVTATGAVCGSPPYMSPEQCLGLPLDHRSDIYSLGCLMYEVICGAPPFSGASSMSIM
ncbi:MAG TPA: serine/threonine-protein kinase [Oculatellaceae cyanobacterium]